MTSGALGPGAEFDLIRRFLQAAPDAAVPDDVRGMIRVGPGDDAAVVSCAGHVVVSTDMVVEGVHFQREWLEPAEIGYRAAAAALSDLAAMAARPLGILLSLALRADEAFAVGPAVVAGARSAAARSGAALLGGDNSRTDGPLVLDVVVLGSVAEPVLRSGAQPGDEVWVTGALGGAAAAVAAWLHGDRPSAAARAAFAAPTPRIAEALWLAAAGVPHALIDISDGLASDAAHVAAASGVAIVIDEAAVPIHDAAAQAGRSAERVLELALAGGEDYELCFTAEVGAVERVRAEFLRRFQVPLTRVGEVRAGGGVMIRGAAGERVVTVRGHDHFRGAGA